MFYEPCHRDTGPTTAPSKLVSAPCVAESPAALERRVTQVTRLIDAAAQECDAYLVLGEVIGVYIDDRLLENGRFTTEKAAPSSSCGYNDYATIVSYTSKDTRLMGSGTVQAGVSRAEKSRVHGYLQPQLEKAF